MSTATAPAPPVPAYNSYPIGYPAKFVIFHDRNPWVYEGILRRARELKARGFAGVGVRYLFEDLRYSKEAADHQAERPAFDFMLDNNLCPWYGRLLLAQEPDMQGFFRLRRTDTEISMTEAMAGQTTMEFD